MERRAGMTAETGRTPRALVLRAPGINCDRETAHACRLAGFETELVHINQLIQQPSRLLDYHLLVIPGGFSYGDDLGAGTLLAKNLTIHLGEQLRQFIDEGRLVLGICNGFQALVRAGLLPDFAPAAATLTTNASGQFECRWVALAVQDSPCIFTRGIDRAIELPVAHGEGQFALADAALLAELQVHKQIPMMYTINAWQAMQMSPSPATPSLSSRSPDILYPANPNGSTGNIAGICNERGNVFGLMPHPERYVQALQHPQRRGCGGMGDGEGDGMLIFKNACEYVKETFCPDAHTPDAHHTPPDAHTPDTHTPDAHKGHPYISAGHPTPEGAGASGNVGMPLVGIRRVGIRGGVAADAYASSGVDIGAADEAKAMMRAAVQASQGREVLAGMGAFAGVFDLGDIRTMRRPALVASTDGVGTKTLIAAQAGRYDSIGYDLVNHSINDLLTQGARPLFFMDYLAMGRLDAQQAAAIVSSVANACREAGCALLGGETAEMPDVYLPAAFDLAGTIVGVVDWDEASHPAAMQPGDVLLGLPSSGLHTNGYSLARHVFAPYALETVFPELGEPLADALLCPHRGYLREMMLLREHLGANVKGAAHITGGGFEGNIARILPEGVQAVIDTRAWDVPPIFRLMQRLGNISPNEMYRTFNMGVGMVLAFSPGAADEARRLLPELLPVGYLSEGTGVVVK
jgi:phosphoribosylaminoimidazole synthetase